MEALGIPAVVLARREFVGVVRNAVAGIGLAPDIAMVDFPAALFLPDADLAPLDARRGEFYAGLTAWLPARAVSGAARLLEVSADSHEAALACFNERLLATHCGDGLPLLPPTPERVNDLLRGAPFARAHVLGRFPPRGATVTVESCAVALALAGGRPEYLPVLVAAVEAFLDPAAAGELLQATSGNPFPVIVVNGPVARQIHLNSGYGLLGPDPQHPAGACIGRALRLLQQNLGGALPGSGTMASFGHMRFTNAVFAEDEEGLPPGWTPYVSERHGFAPGTNCLSLMFANGAENIFRLGANKESKTEEVEQGLARIAQTLRVPNIHYMHGYSNGTPGLLLLTRLIAADLAALGWTRERIRGYLYEHARLSHADLRAAGGLAWLETMAEEVPAAARAQDPWPIAARAANFGVAVAGGAHPSHALWLPGYSPAVIGREIRLPVGFDALIAEADAARAAPPA